LWPATRQVKWWWLGRHLVLVLKLQHKTLGLAAEQEAVEVVLGVSRVSRGWR
jgi:hypothetical protein